MTEQDKQLIIKELFSRLPYGIMINDVEGEVYEINIETVHLEHLAEQVKAGVVDIYLRPMSDMTEEEEDEYNALNGYEKGVFPSTVEAFDWLLEHRFDYRGLIPQGLALEAKEGMYQINMKKM